MHVIWAIRNRAVRVILRIMCRPTGAYHLERLGTGYGSWVIPIDRLPQGGVCYCAGAGEDVSFDIDLVRRFNCSVYTIDPTPRAQKHVAKVTNGLLELQFVPKGMWSWASRMRFYAPRDREHVSHAIVNLERTHEYFEADCTTIPDLMAKLGHEKLDLLKMDIEGAEYEVLEYLLGFSVNVSILCVEFDQPSPIHRTIRMVRKLERAGYKLVNIEGFNFTFIGSHESRGLIPES